MLSIVEDVSSPTEKITRITSTKQTTLTDRIEPTSMLTSTKQNKTSSTPIEKTTMITPIGQTTIVGR